MMWSRLAERCYGLLLRSFPSQHQMHYGSEMLDAFSRERAAIARTEGSWSALRFVFAAYRDVVATGFRERRGAKKKERPDQVHGLLFGIGKDLRHAVRNLTRAWTFTLVCLMSLAIGLGINVAISTLLWVTLAPAPGVEEEGALEVLLMTRGLRLGERWTFPDFDDVRKSDTGMDVTAWALGSRSLRTDDGADDERLSTMYVSANYFTTLGMKVSPGRAFAPEEDDVVGEPPVVVSFNMWENLLGADPQVVGRSLTLNRTVHTVIGVAPRGFVGQFEGQRVDAWVPLWEHPRLTSDSDFRVDRSEGWLQLLGRLKEGTSALQVNAALAAVMSDLAKTHPSTNQIRGARTVRYAKVGLGEEDWRIPKVMLMGLQVMSLLIVSLNIGGMVLVRGAARASELAVRMALGSSRARLVRYLMAESAVLAILGAVLSVAVGWSVLGVIEWQIGQPFPDGLSMTLVVKALGWALAMMLLIGLSPAIKSSRPEIVRALKDDAGGGGRSSGRVYRRATSFQTAVAIPLLVITGIILQSTRLMDKEEYGFQPDGLTVSSLDLATGGYSDEGVASFMQRLHAGVASLPGVQSVSVADAVPLDGGTRDDRVSASGGESGTWVSAGGSRATAGYFETIGTPILSGRGFESGDVAGAEAVAVVTESLSERLWPGQSALGQRVTLNLDRQPNTDLTVVGVVGDVVGSGYGSGFENIFVSQWQDPTSRISLVVRTSSDVATLRRAVKDLVFGLDPELTTPLVLTSQNLTDANKGDVYFISVFVGSLSSLMLLLVALGVYGVVGFAVENRTREIGVRIAMGASRRRVMTLVLLDGLKLTLPGILWGSIVALGLSQYALVIAYDYFGRTALVGVVLAMAAAAVISVVLMASGIPARRATRVRPMEALRAE